MVDLTSWLPDPGALPVALPQDVRLLLDAWEQFGRVVEAVPAPGQGGAIGRLNAGATIVAHVARQQDWYWNSSGLGLDPDSWLAAWDSPGDPPRVPAYEDACAALRRVEERALPYLVSLTSAVLDRVVYDPPGWGPLTVSALIDRSIAHLFAHAGELTALASLVGTPDLGLPGTLRYSIAGRRARLTEGELRY